MAKRRRLSAPDAAEMRDLEAGFSVMPPLETKSMVPPIAQVAADVAARADVGLDRVQQARNQADAEQLHQARQAGLLVSEISLARVDADYLSRDRVALDRAEMDELKASLRNHGQRTPIEVMQTENDVPFGLISGWRRLRALGELLAETGDKRFSSVRAFVRAPGSASDAYVAMVEENEIRANLSHYERGRLAAVSAGQGVFQSVEAAVDHLFSAASKAKRSKIRSFAAIHEALGDLLIFPTHMSERFGLQLAAALRGAGPEQFRKSLAASALLSPSDELQVLETTLSKLDTEKDPTRGGRPSTSASAKQMNPLPLASGGTLAATLTETGFTLRLTGQKVSPIVMRAIMDRVRAIANRP